MRAAHGKAINRLRFLLNKNCSHEEEKTIAINLNLEFCIWRQAATVDMEIISYSNLNVSRIAGVERFHCRLSSSFVGQNPEKTLNYLSRLVVGIALC